MYLLLCQTNTINVKLSLQIIPVCTLIASEKINPVHTVCCCYAVSQCDQRCTTHKQQHVKFSSRLAKVAQTAQKSAQLATLLRHITSPHCSVQRGVISSWNHCYIFCKFLLTPISISKLIHLRKATEQSFPAIYWPNGNLIRIRICQRCNGKPTLSDRHQETQNLPFLLGLCGLSSNTPVA